MPVYKYLHAITYNLCLAEHEFMSVSDPNH
jgi:hypothetical protein